MVEVLEPLEVRAGHTAAVDKHVRGANNATPGKDLLRLIRRWSVGTLEDRLYLDLLGVTSVERFLRSSRDQAVGCLGHEGLRVVQVLLGCAWEAFETSVLDHVVFDFLDVKSIRVVDGRVVLTNGGDQTAIFLNKLAAPVADGTETLHDESLALDAD